MFSGTNALMVPGIARIELAKMIGRTPDILTLIGIRVDWPPYSFRPTTRLAYCTGIRLLCGGHDNDEYDHGQKQDQNQRNMRSSTSVDCAPIWKYCHICQHRRAAAGQDTGKEDHGNAVANALGINLIAQQRQSARNLPVKVMMMTTAEKNPAKPLV